MKHSSNGVFFLSARSRAVSGQLCLHETIDYSVKQLFYKYQNEKKHN